MGERTTIAINMETRDAIAALGKKDESWDELLRRLLVDKIPEFATRSTKEPAG